MKHFKVFLTILTIVFATSTLSAFTGGDTTACSDTVKLKPVKKIPIDKKVVDAKKPSVTVVDNSDAKPQGGCCQCPLKFVQLWTTDDIEQQLVIHASTYLACSQGYLACIQRPEDRIFLLDLHVQVWHEDIANPGVWYQMPVTTPGCGFSGGCEINISIDTNTGNLTVTTYNSLGNYRIVILG